MGACSYKSKNKIFPSDCRFNDSDDKPIVLINIKNELIDTTVLKDNYFPDKEWRCVECLTKDYYPSGEICTCGCKMMICSKCSLESYSKLRISYTTFIEHHHKFYPRNFLSMRDLNITD